MIGSGPEVTDIGIQENPGSIQTCRMTVHETGIESAALAVTDSLSNIRFQSASSGFCAEHRVDRLGDGGFTDLVLFVRITDQHCFPRLLEKTRPFVVHAELRVVRSGILHVKIQVESIPEHHINRGGGRPVLRTVENGFHFGPILNLVASQRRFPGTVVMPEAGKPGTGQQIIIIVTLRNNDVVIVVRRIHSGEQPQLLDIADTQNVLRFLPGHVQRGKKKARKNRDDGNGDKDNLSNILICSILAMTRRKAEGELSDESVDLCTSEQREG